MLDVRYWILKKPQLGLITNSWVWWGWRSRLRHTNPTVRTLLPHARPSGVMSSLPEATHRLCTHLGGDCAPSLADSADLHPPPWLNVLPHPDNLAPIHRVVDSDSDKVHPQARRIRHSYSLEFLVGAAVGDRLGLVLRQQHLWSQVNRGAR
jgi:hypothetical protein